MTMPHSDIQAHRNEAAYWRRVQASSMTFAEAALSTLAEAEYRRTAKHAERMANSIEALVKQLETS